MSKLKTFDEFVNEYKQLKNINEEMEMKKEVALVVESLNDVEKVSKTDMAWRKDSNVYRAVQKPNQEELKGGLYEIKRDDMGNLFLLKQSLKTDELYKLPMGIYDEILNEFNLFWNNKDKYKEYDLVHKRGIMMYGSPGNGKTGIINILIKEVSNIYDGICINVESLSNFIPMIRLIRELEPNKPILAIIEDFDSFIRYENSNTLLNILDGNLQIDNIIYFATTNYIDTIEPRFKSRPSRFDLVVELPLPNDKVREFYLNKKINKEDLKNIDLKTWVEKTEGFSFAMLKELIISVIILKKDFNDSYNRLKEMADKK